MWSAGRDNHRGCMTHRLERMGHMAWSAGRDDGRVEDAGLTGWRGWGGAWYSQLGETTAEMQDSRPGEDGVVHDMQLVGTTVEDVGLTSWRGWAVHAVVNLQR